MNEKPIVAGIGELLWDVVPSGKQMGRAPCNFAYHAMYARCENCGFCLHQKRGDTKNIY